MKRNLLVATALALVLAEAASAGEVIVTPANLGIDWFNAAPDADTRPGGVVVIAPGPAIPPLGADSVHMNTADGASKGQMVTYQYGSYDRATMTVNPGTGVRLADIDAMSYSTWRDGTSTNSLTQVVALNLVVDWVGDGTSFTTLVYEPFYNAPRQGPIAVDRWQRWDAYDGGQAIWWSTRNIPGLPAFTFSTPWSTVVASNPNAEVLAVFGFNAGSGWIGVHIGAADALTFGTRGEQPTTFNFELFPVGACCTCLNSPYDCQEETEPRCLALGGQYVGDGVPCLAANPMEPAAPRCPLSARSARSNRR